MIPSGNIEVKTWFNVYQRKGAPMKMRKKLTSVFVICIPVMFLLSAPVYINAQSIGIGGGVGYSQNFGRAFPGELTFFLPLSERIIGSFNYMRWMGMDNDLQWNANQSSSYYKQKISYSGLSLFYKLIKKEDYSFMVGGGVGTYKDFNWKINNIRSSNYWGVGSLSAIFESKPLSKVSFYIKGQLNTPFRDIKPLYGIMTFGLRFNLFNKK